MIESTVVPLFVSEEALEAAWKRYDEAMLLVHRLYQNDEPDEAKRLAAVNDAMSAETAFRTAFARTAPRRIAG